MLALAGAMEKISPQDIFVGPTEAVLNYLSSQHDEAAIQELLHSGQDAVRSLLQASLATAPAERNLAAITDNLSQEIKRSDV
jgi:hypothetical protein